MKNPLGTFLNGLDDPWKTFGTDDLCTWREPLEPGVCRFQTRDPAFARRLSRRSASSQSSTVGVWGGYLRIFLEQMERWQARRLVTRYLKAANEGFQRPAPSPKRAKRAGKVVAADKSQKRL